MKETGGVVAEDGKEAKQKKNSSRAKKNKQETNASKNGQKETATKKATKLSDQNHLVLKRVQY